MGISFLFSFAFCFSSFLSYLSGLLRQPFCLLHFFFLGMVLITAFCKMSWTSIHSSSGILSIISNPLKVLVTCTVQLQGIWFRSYLNGLVVFPTFFNLSLNLVLSSSWSVSVSSWCCFCWLYRTSPSLAEKNIINLILVLTIWWCPFVESSLVLLEEGVCYDQCILLSKLC